MWNECTNISFGLFYELYAQAETIDQLIDITVDSCLLTFGKIYKCLDSFS